MKTHRNAKVYAVYAFLIQFSEEESQEMSANVAPLESHLKLNYNLFSFSSFSRYRYPVHVVLVAVPSSKASLSLCFAFRQLDKFTSRN